MPKAGSLVAIVLQLGSNVTTGSITIEPTINGTKVTPGDLDLVANVGSPNNVRASIAPGTSGFTFSAGGQIGIMATTTGDYAPSGNDTTVHLYFVFDT
jgi:hypothetical protein